MTNTPAALYQVNVYSANRGNPSFSNLGLSVLKRSAIIIFGVSAYSVGPIGLNGGGVKEKRIFSVSKYRGVL